ncbi:MAG: RIO1 family regulatory kinase/ATPase [Steroidobacteraceae bacterium]
MRTTVESLAVKIPKGLQPLLDDGMIDSVVRSLKSGKEASVYIVSGGGRLRCAKVYKEAERRGFHKLAQYQEGRKTRSSRDARAMGKRGRHGRKVQEAEWKNAEVEALYRLVAAGVRVPAPHLVTVKLWPCRARAARDAIRARALEAIRGGRIAA